MAIDTNGSLEDVVGRVQTFMETSAKNALTANANSSDLGLKVDVGAKGINTAANGPGKIQPPNN